MTFKPIKLAIWLFIFAVSFGVSLNWAWLVLLGLLVPILLLVISIIGAFLKR